MENILTRDGDYLTIFQSPVKINDKLPKWKNLHNRSKDEEPSTYTIGYNSSTNSNVQEKITLKQFLDFKTADFNVYIGRKVENHLREQNYKTSSPNLIWLNSTPPEGQSNIIGGNKERGIKKIVKFFRKNKKKNKTVNEEVHELDVMQFFSGIKFTCKENAQHYIERIKPYMIALKQAEEMGQQALVDQLTMEIFVNKYESILYSENMHYRITEEQIVDFVKKTEKGVRLDYIENFARPIPVDIIEKKKKADELLVFDNYCVMYYDPELKSYKMTKEEEEALRRKKTDPILFGMISGTRNLYYVADWIDEYCDLTLEEFLKVSGIEKQDISIDEQINF